MNAFQPTPPSLSGHRPATTVAHELAVGKVIRHMRQNLIAWDTDLSLKALARKGCYSTSRLIDVFEKVTGTTPHHYLASLRIQKAKELLLDSNASVTEIALAVGYRSFPTFSRTFAEYVGTSPSAFRQMRRTVTLVELAAAASAFRERNKESLLGETIEGRTVVPRKAAGVIFVGTFSRGVPQGRPESGTVLLQPGCFRIARPPHAQFHLLAAMVSLPTTGHVTAHTILPTLVSNQRIHRFEPQRVELALRPIRSTDPPLVVSLPSLLA